MKEKFMKNRRITIAVAAALVAVALPPRADALREVCVHYEHYTKATEGGGTLEVEGCAEWGWVTEAGDFERGSGGGYGGEGRSGRGGGGGGKVNPPPPPPATLPPNPNDGSCTTPVPQATGGNLGVGWPGAAPGQPKPTVRIQLGSLDERTRKAAEEALTYMITRLAQGGYRTNFVIGNGPIQPGAGPLVGVLNINVGSDCNAERGHTKNPSLDMKGNKVNQSINLCATQSKSGLPHAPSSGFGTWDDYVNEFPDRAKATIQHEFGHTLGLGHQESAFIAEASNAIMANGYVNPGGPNEASNATCSDIKAAVAIQPTLR